MSDKWMIKSDVFGTCNCAANCGCQFNLPSTYGHCEFVEAGVITEGYFNDISLDGLIWAFMMIWPGEIAEGNGKKLVIIDDRADADQREALLKIVDGEAGEPGSNHFSVFGSTCTETLEPLFLPIDYQNDIKARTAHIKIGDFVDAVGSPMINEFDGSEFHIALARTKGSFEFTYAEVGKGTTKTTGPMAMEMTDSYAQFNIIHYNQDGLVA